MKSPRTALARIEDLNEQLARALCRHNDADPDQLDEAGQPRWRWYLRDVEAVLAALGDAGRAVVRTRPDQAMIQAGTAEVRAVVPSIFTLPASWPEGEAAVAACWRAMLEVNR